MKIKNTNIIKKFSSIVKNVTMYVVLNTDINANEVCEINPITVKELLREPFVEHYKLTEEIITCIAYKLKENSNCIKFKDKK